MTTRVANGAEPSAGTSEISKDNVTRFQAASWVRARWQVINSFVPYVLLWVAMVYALEVSYWLMLPLAVLAAGFLVRIFIIFHDCGHASFFASKRANNAMGVDRRPVEPHALPSLALAACAAPWDRGRSGQARLGRYLDAHGSGIYSRHPLAAICLSVRTKPDRPVRGRAAVVFVVHNRFAEAGAPKRERQSVRRTNWALLGITMVMSVAIGLKAFLLIELTVRHLPVPRGCGCSTCSINSKARTGHDPRTGITPRRHPRQFIYKLPEILQWFTGNIGFHHIHHLSPRIPNYHLSDATTRTRSSRRSNPLPCSRVSRASAFVCGTSSGTHSSAFQVSPGDAAATDHTFRRGAPGCIGSSTGTEASTP